MRSECKAWIIKLFSLLFTAFCAVFGTALLTVSNALCIKRTTDDVITYTREVTYSTSSDKHYRVLLKVVADTGNVANCFKTVGKFNFCNFTKSRVRLLRCGCVNLCANASFLRCGCVGGLVCECVETYLKYRSLRLVSLVRGALRSVWDFSRELKPF